MSTSPKLVQGGNMKNGEMNSGHRAVVPVIPPGFSADALRASSLSAPPPGFHNQAEQKHQRDQTAAMLLNRHKDDNYGDMNGNQMNQPRILRGEENQGQTHQHTLLRDVGELSMPSMSSHQKNHFRPSPGFIGSGRDVKLRTSSTDSLGDAGRSTSFADLAAALGESMAQSMDESLNRNGHPRNFESANHAKSSSAVGSSSPTYLGGSYLDNQEQVNDESKSHTDGALLSENLTPKTNGVLETGAESYELDNYQRQSRHISSRLIGPRITALSETNANSGVSALYSSSRIGAETGQNGELRTNTTSSQLTGSIQQEDLGFLGSESSSMRRHSLKNEPVGVSRNFDSTSVDSRSRSVVDHSPIPGDSGNGLLFHAGLRLQHEKGRASAPPELELLTANSKGARVIPYSHFGQTGVPTKHAGLPPSPNPILEVNDGMSSLSLSSKSNDDMASVTEKELEPFLKETMHATSMGGPALPPHIQPSAHPSRGLALVGNALPLLSLSDVKARCESFGSLDGFRSDFCESRAVIFVSYFDLRCAQLAAVRLPNSLLSLAQASLGAGIAHNESTAMTKVKYCIPLNASAPTDESTIHLSNLPSHVDEHSLTTFMDSFGGVRTVHYQVMSAGMSGQGVDDDLDGPAYVVEFHDIRDAKQALQELQSTEPWGPAAHVEVGMRNPTKRRQAKDLLRLLGRWRMASESGSRLSQAVDKKGSRSPPPPAMLHSSPFAPSANGKVELGFGQKSQIGEGGKNTPLSVSPIPSACASPMPQQGHGDDASAHTPRILNPQLVRHDGRHPQQNQAQLVMGPDGQYSYVTVSSVPVQGGSASPYGAHRPFMTAPHNDQHAHYSAPQYAYVNPHSHHPSGMQQPIAVAGHGPHHLVMPSYIDVRTGYPVSPVFVPVGGSNADNSISSGGVNSQFDGKHRPRGHLGDRKNGVSKTKRGANGNMVGPVGGAGGGEDPTLTLNIEAVKNGIDRRTSLMVRNIPNKYTQKMLLDEFSEGGHGSDKIDFFYLPIDFKNKCNRGYAFVNFVDFRDIVSFHEQYDGNAWKVFNSDKICQITYARIQGKPAMLKRFEHSALLDKEDEYRPLVFHSHGPKKGEREAFPAETSSP